MNKLVENLVVEDINSPEILSAYAEIDHASRIGGRNMGKNDVWIAATAKVAGAKLLTTGTDFEHLSTASPHHKKGMPAIDLIWIDPSLGKSKK